MTKGKKIMISVIVVITIVMIAVVCYFMMVVDAPLIDHISFVDKINNITIEPYYDDTDDIYYVFIPSYVTLKDMKVQKSDFIKLKFSSETDDYGNNINSIPLDEKVIMSLKNFKTNEEYTFEFRQNANVPTLYLETESGSLDYVNETEGNKEETSVLLIGTDGVCNVSSMAKIEGRGNSTWWQAKKPYNLKFDDKVNLIGSQSSNKWALLANYSDSSGIRNALSYYLGEEMKFEYTSEINYISLYVNGSYMGLYTAAIKGYKTDDNATNIFEQSRSNKDYDWVSDNDGYYIFRRGNENYIQDIINKFENSLYSENATFDDVSKYIDVESFAKKYLLESFVQNEDSQLSQYFIIDDNGKIKAINPWDYDLTFGISWDAHYDIQTNRIYMPNIWYSTLYQFDEFKDEVSSFLDDYKELLTVKLSNKVDELETMLNIDWYNDKIRWQNEKPFGSGSAGAENTKLKSMNYDFSSFIDNCQYIKDHIIKRFAFLSDYWKSPEKYYNITFRDEAISDTDVYIKKGTEITQEVLPDGILNIDEEGFIGWYTKDGISLYDVKNVTEDIIFYSKYDELHISNDKEETDSNANSLEIKNSTSSSESSYKVSTFTKYIPSSIKTFLKKVYHHSGLDILGKNGLIICGIFGILLIAVIIAEIVTMIRQRRDSR